MNLVYGPARHESFVARRLEYPTGVRKVLGSIPVWYSDFSLSRARDIRGSFSIDNGDGSENVIFEMN